MRNHEGHPEFPIPVVDKPLITYFLIAANISTFMAAMLLDRIVGPNYLLIMGAKLNELIRLGEYWRFFTPIFLHNGIVHLAINCYSLYAVGPEVEKMYGRFSFVIIYMVAGILGNIASFAFCPSLSVGASGAIFGLLGALLYLGIKYRAVISNTYVINIATMIALNLIYGFLHPYIDNSAHLGGLIGGYITAYLLGVGTRRSFTKTKIIVLAFFVIIAALGLYIGYAALLKPVCL